MESVVVGVDRSDASRRAVKFALDRAHINHWQIRVAHVINWSRFSFPTLEDNAARPLVRKAEIERAQTDVIDPILEWIADHDLGDVDVKSGIYHGRPSEVLADVARNEGYDAIVVGRIGESNLRTAIFGSTASRLVQYATVPVVVVP
ncbi:universal stress protein [Rhodococcus sp. NPDC049939]|uniref:universal stress protein n=1 Tax=Rhodococcus sp. NPDC049939 TaxID=3155511 RepID=UPI0033F6B0E5